MARKNSNNFSAENAAGNTSKRLGDKERREAAYADKIRADNKRADDYKERLRKEAALSARVASEKATFTPDQERIYSFQLMARPAMSLQDKWDLIVEIKGPIEIDNDPALAINLFPLSPIKPRKKPQKPSSESKSFLGIERREAVSRLDETRQIAANLASKYGVNVGFVETDKDLFSDEQIKRSVAANSYFISAENPVQTGKTTDYLIRYEKERKQQEAAKNHARKLELLVVAHEVQTEKSNQTALDVAPIISGIIASYRESNKGKSPSFHKIAEALNEQNTPTPRGQEKWFAQTVKRTLARLDTQKSK